MTYALRILIIGGYGVFGGRIVQLLEQEKRLEIIVAGRSVEKANAFITSRTAASATLCAAHFDRTRNVKAQIAELKPDLVIDASGPFQAYGAAQYRVVNACIMLGVHYLDLADGSDFVDGVAAFDAEARAANVFVLTGASSFPVLTAAVVRRLSAGLATLSFIRGGIAPSPYAGVGENVIRAIAGYAGQSVSMKRNGQKSEVWPFTEQMRFTIAPPGHTPLRRTLFSLVDVPDLRALPILWPNVKTVWMGAGPSPEFLHRVLIFCAWLVRLKIVASLSPLAPLMHFVTNRLRWGEHRGGMFVVIEGFDENRKAVRRSWHLLAEGDDGPLIPSMAVEAIVRKMLAGHMPPAGARAAVSDLELDDYESLFAGRTLFAGIRTEADENQAFLYGRLLGPALRRLPIAIQRMHTRSLSTLATGRGSVTRGRNPLAQLAATIVGFPNTSAETDVSVRFDVRDGMEIWTRRFGAHEFSSLQYAGTGGDEVLLCERFGPMKFAMALIVETGRLKLELRRWSVFGLPLPMWLCPKSNSYETESEGRFKFHVEISHPLVGLIIRYDGWLERVDEAVAA